MFVINKNMNRNDYKQLNNAYKNNTNVVVEGFTRKSITPFGCPASTYCPDSEQKKRAYDISCPEGFYCPEAVMDSLPSELLPLSCPSGFYCPKDKKRPYPCPSKFPFSNRMSKKCEDCFNDEQINYVDKDGTCYR
jgi:hypothetical protein